MKFRLRHADKVIYLIIDNLVYYYILVLILIQLDIFIFIYFLNSSFKSYVFLEHTSVFFFHFENLSFKLFLSFNHFLHLISYLLFEERVLSLHKLYVVLIVVNIIEADPSLDGGADFKQ